MSVTGQCLCGAIKYEISNPLTTMGVCHCKNCQRQAGSAFSTLAAVPVSDFSMTGTPKLYQDQDTTSGDPVERYFCEHCGSPIYSALGAQPEAIYLKTGTLDDTADFAPQFQAWCDTKQNWVELVDGVPAIPTQ
ncbi:MAG: GFA family protein [Pseudomonadota bacterium]